MNFQNKKPILGMLHLGALPGSSNYQNRFEEICSRTFFDAEALLEGGVDGLVLENYFDLPFYPDTVPSVTVSHLAVIARKLKNNFKVPLGINVLRNDGMAALAIAKAVGAEWVRVNILTGARLTDQGIVSGKAHEILRYRKKIGADSVKIFADVSVKYSSSLSERTLEAEVEETLHRSGADGLIVSGEATGKPVDVERLKTVKKISSNTPVWLGSGVNEKNIEELTQWADGFIIGSAFKKELSAPVEKEKVEQIVKKARGLR